MITDLGTGKLMTMVLPDPERTFSGATAGKTDSFWHIVTLVNSTTDFGRTPLSRLETDTGVELTLTNLDMRTTLGRLTYVGVYNPSGNFTMRVLGIRMEHSNVVSGGGSSGNISSTFASRAPDYVKTTAYHPNLVININIRRRR